MVSLTSFDILGNELNILLNENQRRGNYNANFDSSHLARGVYFYKPQVGDFGDKKDDLS